MERLTYDFAIGDKHCWEVHGADNLTCEDVCKNQSSNGKGCEDCPIRKAIDRLAAYENTELMPEEIQAHISAKWIYGNVDQDSAELMQKIEAVEKALGFKLFVWQKDFIARGQFRKMGDTTARILRDILDVSGKPIDYTRGAATQRQQFYRRELRKIKEKLDRAGIPARTVFFYERDKRKEGVSNADSDAEKE